MKLKQKLLAVLVAVGFAGGAHAVVDNSVGGNGSLILGVINYDAQVSALFDLGATINTFQPGAAFTGALDQTWNLSTDANYSAAWTAFTAAAVESTSRYVVFAGDALGSAPGDDRFLSTSSTDLSVVTNRPSNTQLLNWVGASGGSNVDLVVSRSNALGNHGQVADGANFASAAANANEYLGGSTAFLLNGRFSNVGPFSSTGSIDTNLSFAQLATSSASGLARATTTIYAGPLGNSSFFLDSTNGRLTFTTPVPEADTWAMFAVGLLAVGAIARRRLQS